MLAQHSLGLIASNAEVFTDSIRPRFPAINPLLTSNGIGDLRQPVSSFLFLISAF